MEHDIQQKVGLVKLFWHWGYVPDIDVKLFHALGTAKKRLELTDVDVLGFKIDPELRPQRIAGDCKTKKGTSSINRSFWLSGIMNHLAIERGFVVLSKNIEIDHKIASQHLGITLLNENEFRVLTDALLPPEFPHQMNLFNADIWQKFLTEAQSQHSVEQLWGYRRNKYWQDTPQEGLRYTLMETRKHRKSFEQKNRILNTIFVDVMTAFSMSLSQMLSEIFQVYLISNQKEALDHQMKVYVYGGRGTYDHLNNLTRLLMELRFKLQEGSKIEPQIPNDALALPEWEHFIQVFRTALDAPSQFFAVPRLLRYVLFERMLTPSSSVDVLEAIPNLSNLSVKLTLDLLEYFSAATQIPEEVWRPIRDILDKILLRIPSATARQLAQDSYDF
jgi:hypothetical protein